MSGRAARMQDAPPPIHAAVAINTASCVSIINAERHPKPFSLALNTADSSSPMHFQTPTAAYCWCTPTSCRTVQSFPASLYSASKETEYDEIKKL